MAAPCSDADLLAAHRELIRLNDIVDGMIYLQVTRGNPGDRDFAYPGPEVTPTLVMFTQIQTRPRRQPRRQDRLARHLGPRCPLGPPRHQDGAASLPLDGQDDGQGRQGG